MLKNLLVACGAYYLTAWFHGPLVWLWSFVSNRLSFTTGFESIVVMPIVMGLPEIVVAIGAGAAVAAFVESKHAIRWVAVPASLFVLQHVFARHEWVQPPALVDQAGLVVGTILPVIACALGATAMQRRLASRGRLTSA